MAAAAPRATCVILPHERHMIGLTAPEAINAALAEWLAAPERESAQ